METETERIDASRSVDVVLLKYIGKIADVNAQVTGVTGGENRQGLTKRRLLKKTPPGWG